MNSRSKITTSSEGRTGMDNKAEQTLLVIGAPQHDASVYHLSGFLAPDPVICLRVEGAAGGKRYLVVSSMEYGRAEREARADDVLSFDELNVMELAREL
jgi:Xaa-Pro aminopeptidase